MIETGFHPMLDQDLAKNPDWNDHRLIADGIADAQAFCRVLADVAPAVIVVDQYFLTQHWIDGVRTTVPAQFVVLEDLGRQWNQVEFVVNGNLGGDTVLADGSPAVSLVGSRYCLLSGEYREFRRRGLRPPSSRERIVVFAGGGNTGGAPLAYLKVASEIASGQYGIDLVVGSSHPELQVLSSFASSHPDISLHIDVHSLAHLYVDARLALGTGGVSSWERAALGVPTLMTSLTQNQVPVCEKLAANGIATYAGRFCNFDHEEFLQLASSLLHSPQSLDSMSRRGMATVDAFGAARVLRRVTGDLSGLRLRQAKPHDVQILFEWANDSIVRKNSKSLEPIGWDEHTNWFTKVLNSSTSRLFVLELGDLPVGQIRFDSKEGVLVLNYSVDRDFRARGLGRILVEEGIEAIGGAVERSVLAVVREENVASRKVFEALGFSEVESGSMGFVHFVLDLLKSN